MTWRAGSVWPAVAAHAVNNGIAAALVLGREAAEPAEPGRGAALALLAAGCAAVAVLAAGYRAATARAPPLPGPDAVADPAGPSGFRWERVPVAYWGALLLGGVFLALLLS